VTPGLASRAYAALRVGGARRVRLIAYRGDAVECPCCDRRFARFVAHSWGGVGFCPNCRSHERHRTLWLFLRDATNVLSEPLSLLHFAPEPVLKARLLSAKNLDYTTADLSSTDAEHHFDITEIPYPADSFDLIICSHVLEHVGDDRRAMGEMLRVLRPGGSALILVPLDTERPTTYEDPSITSPEGRLRAFLQEDHLRVYGTDFTARLEGAGLSVSVERYAESLDDSLIRRYGLLPDDWIFIGEKPGAPSKLRAG
jgi:SAM-dependent methyltransferase